MKNILVISSTFKSHSFAWLSKCNKSAAKVLGVQQGFRTRDYFGVPFISKKLENICSSLAMIKPVNIPIHGVAGLRRR